jgi:hypothetical protein
MQILRRGSTFATKWKFCAIISFHLAFENQKEPDSVTGKLVWGTLLASCTLPVYLVASNVKEHAPPISIIAVGDFATTQELAQQ